MKTSNSNREVMIEYAVELICNQIRDDYTCAVYGGDKAQISLCARWIPRETSPKFGWLFKLIALHYIPDYYLTARTRDSLDRAYRKTYREFSKIITGLNRILDTVQIKMCANQWSAINHTKLTCLTIRKSSAAFLNYSKRRGPVINDDRIQCAKNFISCKRIDRKQSDRKQPSNNHLCDIVETAITENLYGREPESDMDTKWMKLTDKCTNFENMVAMIDMSASMCMNYSLPLYTALGLGIAIAEKSCIGRRVLTFSTHPSWISLEHCGTFTECISQLTNNYMTSQTTIHIYAALNEILQTCIEKKISNEIVSRMTLVIFTDMDLKIADVNYHRKQFQRIREQYSQHGYTEIPNILFWNLYNSNTILSYSKNSGELRKYRLFPKIDIAKPITVINGFNKYLLDAFMKKGMAALGEITEWKMLSSLLENDRYSMVDDFFE